ncbi:unnamed protein product [Caenorhabditis auriculariae]|uniref:Uncharacterized protein n=1 Tax=Caenorhabditis auriculariae TaxID=2777116 RepID=A0A8S1HQ09_9PELO|nr:unnamed protein product [Caenorhabditis auriculariae]
MLGNRTYTEVVGFYEIISSFVQMTYDLSRLSQDLPTSERSVELNGKFEASARIQSNSSQRRLTLSRSSSIDSVATDVHLPDCFSSDELDKLSSCLSETPQCKDASHYTTLPTGVEGSYARHIPSCLAALIQRNVKNRHVSREIAGYTLWRSKYSVSSSSTWLDDETLMWTSSRDGGIFDEEAELKWEARDDGDDAEDVDDVASFRKASLAYSIASSSSSSSSFWRNHRRLSVSSSSSFIDGGQLVEDVDPADVELVQVSSEGGAEKSTSVLYDIVQAQLALWTCAFSLLYSYAWMQHRKKFLLSIFIVVPTTFFLTCAMSSLLTTIVVIGRLFSAPVNYEQYLRPRLGNAGSIDYDDRDYGGGIRQRSYSGASSVSCDDGLPKPLCRRHSGSHTSLCSRPPSVNRKLSYAYSHYNANSGDISD